MLDEGSRLSQRTDVMEGFQTVFHRKHLFCEVVEKNAIGNFYQ